MAWAHKGVMRLPVCFRPSAFHAKLTRASLSPPAGAEAAGKYLYRVMLGVAGFSMHKRLGDTNLIISSLGILLPSTSSTHDVPKLDGQEQQNLELLSSHPAWAAAQSYLSAERKAAFRRVLEAGYTSVADLGVSCQERELEGGADGGVVEGEQLPLLEEVKDLRQRVIALQHKLSEAKNLERGWQTVAIATEKELTALRKSYKSNEQPFSVTNAIHSSTPSQHDTAAATRIATGIERSADAALAKREIQRETEWETANGKESVLKKGGTGGGDVADMSGAGANAAEGVKSSSTKVIVLSGRASAPREDSRKTPSSSAPTFLASPNPPSSKPPPPKSETCQDGTSANSSTTQSTHHTFEQPASLSLSSDPLSDTPTENEDDEMRRNNALAREAARKQASARDVAPPMPSPLDDNANNNNLTVDNSNNNTDHVPSFAVSAANTSASIPALESTDGDPRSPASTPSQGEKLLQEAAEAATSTAGTPALAKAARDAAAATAPQMPAAEETQAQTVMTTEEKMIQAAIERLAMEDAIENAKEQRQRQNAAAADATLTPSSASARGAHDKRNGQEQGSNGDKEQYTSSRPHTPPCPPGFQCSDSRVSVLAAQEDPCTSTSTINSIAEDGGPYHSSASQPQEESREFKGSSGEPREGRGKSVASGRALGDNPAEQRGAGKSAEDVVESLRQAQEAARRRAEALKAGRRMLTQRDKADKVALGVVEILRAAHSAEAHPMFKRAVAAADAVNGPEPDQAEDPRPDVHSRQPEDRLQKKKKQPEHRLEEKEVVVSIDATAPTMEMHESTPQTRASPTSPDQTDAAAAAEGLAAAAAPGSSVQHCGLGIGVGAAAHGTWKVSKLVVGGSVDRANNSLGTTRMLVGDILVSVDGSSLSGVSVAVLSQLVKGAHGSQVTLQFYSISDASVHTMSIDRICE